MKDFKNMSDEEFEAQAERSLVKKVLIVCALVMVFGGWWIYNKGKDAGMEEAVEAGLQIDGVLERSLQAESSRRQYAEDALDRQSQQAIDMMGAARAMWRLLSEAERESLRGVFPYELLGW